MNGRRALSGVARLASYERADADLPEINEARTALAPASAPPFFQRTAMLIASGVAALGAVLLAVRRFMVMGRGTLPTPPQVSRAERRRRGRARR